jgi:hypothetical protein
MPTMAIAFEIWALHTGDCFGDLPLAPVGRDRRRG